MPTLPSSSPAGPPAEPPSTPSRRRAAATLAGAGLLALAPATAGARARSGPEAPTARARLVSATRVSERYLDLTIDSPALGGAGHARVLLPPGWDAEPARRWPALYLLHGCCGGPTGWHAWPGAGLEEIVGDRPLLVVCPDGGPAGFYSDWWNGGRYGPPAWERFHLTELRRIMERRVRANGERAAAGLSMGGMGALVYASRNPSLFRSAASFSGVVRTHASPAVVQNIVRGQGLDPAGLWGDPTAQAAVWAEHDPYELLPRLPRGFPVFISAGDGTPGPLDPPDRGPDSLEATLGTMAHDYVARARAHGLNVTADLYGPGTHTWPYWTRALSGALPMLAASIGAG
ncbi:alpha/beta hydrolase [Streptomyces sp. SBT349]|uniref:alpha/beta hydrolase n=1 Tax=Streptomyces sp. SBT349 TaxID=1580539 RepID=UPI00066C10C0|nr:alpha/beta hydrolase family protein [Streptomyces sp. SBT349]